MHKWWSSILLLMKLQWTHWVKDHSKEILRDQSICSHKNLCFLNLVITVIGGVPRVFQGFLSYSINRAYISSSHHVKKALIPFCSKVSIMWISSFDPEQFKGWIMCFMYELGGKTLTNIFRLSRSNFQQCGCKYLVRVKVEALMLIWGLRINRSPKNVEKSIQEEKAWFGWSMHLTNLEKSNHQLKNT